jgi:dihydroorotate dehydrogenase
MSHNVDGMAVSNTTLTRRRLRDPAARETGGLSGRPIFHRSTVMLARVYEATGGKIPLIGIGGIDSGETALAKIEAGATLVQLYTGLIYEGPGLIQRIKDHLTQAVRREGVFAISDLIGKQAQAWAAKPLDA